MQWEHSRANKASCSNLREIELKKNLCVDFYRTQFGVIKCKRFGGQALAVQIHMSRT